MTDPISQMIITMKNGSRADRKTVIVPYSKLKHAIADCLVKQGYLNEASKKTENNKPVLVLGIVYEENGPKLIDIKRISKQSKRVYFGVKDIRPVKNGLGITVFSTPKGILTDKEARKEMVGGEALFKLW